MGKMSAVPQAAPKTKPTSFDVGATKVTCLIRHLMGAEEGKILRDARAYAVANGVADPKPEDPLYLLGNMYATVLYGYVDEQAPAELFFDGGAAQISACFDRDQIAMLWARQQAFQDECSGMAAAVTDAEVLAWVYRIAMGGADQLDELRPHRKNEVLRRCCSLVIDLTKIIEATANEQRAAAPAPAAPSAPVSASDGGAGAGAGAPKA